MPHVNSHGLELFYLKSGTGPALVFVHGTGGNAILWFKQFERFAESNTCIAYDHRGFGRSSGPPDSFRAEYFADDVKAILDAENISNCVLICSSLGGWTGVKFALQYPEMISGLVICNSTASVDLPIAIEACEASKPRSEAEGAMAVAFSPDFIQNQPLLVYLFEQIQMATPIEHQLPWELVYDRIMGADQLTSVGALAEISCPSLHIDGDLDRIFPPDVIEAVASKFPNPKFVVIPGVAHCPWIEDPDAFNDVLKEFLSGITR